MFEYEQHNRAAVCPQYRLDDIFSVANLSGN